MQVKHPHHHPGAKPKKTAAPSGPTLKVSAFVDLMKRLLPHKEILSDEQVRFIQNAIQRFDSETEGLVKTKFLAHKNKKTAPRHPIPAATETPAPSSKSKNFIERLVRLANEDDALLAIQQLSDADAERLAQEQGLRASSPDVARSKLAETITTLREIERIAGAGTKNSASK